MGTTQDYRISEVRKLLNQYSQLLYSVDYNQCVDSAKVKGCARTALQYSLSRGLLPKQREHQLELLKELDRI